ncbi:hypothetical protein O0I10_012851 [Lichtheimia ornata]|uniref:Integrase catalytic domain-containing protein n=1 Tax=Lichtheimia ornata TaxID=688661 RepID=A0AAD7XSR3_9FUNG|nr:uncharacterized protein O0I10_012851 [Lichtheimia ornata]KAJ8651576.1 hypothetical protein O0I10_012851 [Lichtheimia ornata]
MYNDMKRVLEGKQPTGSHEANFQWWVRNTFNLKVLPGGTTCIVRKEGNRNAGKYIAIKEHLYDMIASAHEQTCHGRRDAMKFKFKNYLYCPSRFVKDIKTSARAIHVESFLSKLQMDLVDFGGKTTPTGDMRYILHVKDHRTKYSWAYPLPYKLASEVCKKLHALFCEVGPPDELQSDNAVNSLQTTWLTTS